MRRLLCVLVPALLVSACATYVEVPVETPLQSKIDVAAFRRVLIAGFVVEPSADTEVELQSETVRLLQNQLRAHTKLQVLEPDRPPLLEALDKAMEGKSAAAGSLTASEREQYRLEGDRAIQDGEYWRKIGEEFQTPLIVSGKMAFDVQNRSGFESEERVVREPNSNRSRIVRGNRYLERKAFSLSAEFVFIDGKTGQILHREKFTEEVLYGEEQKVSPLSAYFELMDRLLPNVLGIVSPQRIRGQRILLR
jgi:hypothetical protein